jgi:hypothetical protein
MPNSLMRSTNCAACACATAAPERITENFVTESRLEFLPERERMTTSDRAILDGVRGHRQGASPPAASFIKRRANPTFRELGICRPAAVLAFASEQTRKPRRGRFRHRLRFTE